MISRNKDRNFDKSPIRTLRLRIIQAAGNQMINFQFSIFFLILLLIIHQATLPPAPIYSASLKSESLDKLVD